MSQFVDARNADLTTRNGPGREITVTAAAVRNGAALNAGSRYIFYVISGVCCRRDGGNNVTADILTDMRYEAGTYFYFQAGRRDTTTALGGDRYVSLLRADAGTPTVVRVCQTDDSAAVMAAPPAWS